jgi:hypothetical protein
VRSSPRDLDEVWTEEYEKEISKGHRQLLFDLLADGAGIALGRSERANIMSLRCKSAALYNYRRRWDLGAEGTKLHFS